MKARIFTTAVLMIVALTTFAQTSRRGDREKEKNTRTEERKNNDNKSQQSTETRRSQNEQPANNNQDNRSRREYRQTDNSSTQQRTEVNENQQNNSNQNSNGRVYTRENQNENSGQSGNGRVYTRDNNNQSGDSRGNTRENNEHPGVNQNNQNNPGNRGNEGYSSGGNHRGNDRVVVNTEQHSRDRRDFVQINQNHRKVVVVNHPRDYRPTPVEVRRSYHPYRQPIHRDIVWSITLRNDFRIYYPEIRFWRYDIGYRIPMAAAYDAIDYVGDVARIYGKVFETYYEYETDEYYVYFGDYYPYQDFSIIIPGNEARRMSRRPERLFRRANVEVTGYITMFDDKPEMVIRNANQIEFY